MKTIAFTIAGVTLVASQVVSEDPVDSCKHKWSQLIVCITECDDLSYAKADQWADHCSIADGRGTPEHMRQQLIQMCKRIGVDEFKSWYTDYASEDDCPELTAPPTDPPTYSPSVYCKQEYSQEIVSVSSCDELHSSWPQCVADEGGDPAAFALLLEQQCKQYGLEEYQGWYQDCANDINKCVDYYQTAAPSPARNVGGGRGGIRVAGVVTSATKAIASDDDIQECIQEYSKKVVSISSCGDLDNYKPQCVTIWRADPTAFGIKLDDECRGYEDTPGIDGVEQFKRLYRDCADDINNCWLGVAAKGFARRAPRPVRNIGGQANAASTNDVSQDDSAGSKRLMERLIKGSA